MERFRVVYEDDGYEERGTLVEVNEKGETIRELGWDYGEPEDNSFRRDWAWVVGELNALADRIRELENK